MTADTVIGQIIEGLKAEPSRTWSIIVTLFGDAVIPRGGSIWLGSLLDVFEAMGVAGSVVRTAASRLTADNWLERHRVGRNAYYQLSRYGLQAFERAAVQVYDGASRPWDGVLTLALVAPDADKEGARSTLKTSGYAAIMPDLWVTPRAGDGAMPEGAIALNAGASGHDLIALARLAWPIDGLARSYARFIDRFAPLQAVVGAAALEPLDALIARTLLVHEYRRIILRDPLLPAELLPRDWPGERARRLCGDLYHPLLPASEAWLSANARRQDGPLPPAPADIYRRFRAPSNDI